MKNALIILTALFCLSDSSWQAQIGLPSDSPAGRGCCSHHGGESYCGYDHHWVCSDGWESSCRC